MDFVSFLNTFVAKLNLKEMKKIRNLLFVSVILGSILIKSNTCFGQYNFIGKDLTNRRNVVTTAVPFLLITPDSRSGALGDAGVALSPDANSIHWNPAKLAFIESDLGVSLSYVPWLKALVPDINLSYLSYYMRIDEISTFGASLRYFSLGDIAFTNDQGEHIGDFRPNELALDGAYARKLSKSFSLGLALRLIYSNLAGNLALSSGAETKPGWAFAGDISGFWKVKPLEVAGRDLFINVGGNISNVGSKITYTDKIDRDFIPINLRLGTALKYEIDEYNDITLVFDLNKLLVPSLPVYQTDSSGRPVTNPDQTLLIYSGENPDVPVIQGILQSFYDAPGGSKEEIREINPSVGLEYWYKQQFAFRAGYFYEHKTKGNRQFFSVGIGLKYNILNLDVSYLIPSNTGTASQTSPLDKTLRFTLQFDFGQMKENKGN